jgi:hypothetical protein
MFLIGTIPIRGESTLDQLLSPIEKVENPVKVKIITEMEKRQNRKEQRRRIAEFVGIFGGMSAGLLNIILVRKLKLISETSFRVYSVIGSLILILLYGTKTIRKAIQEKKEELVRKNEELKRLIRENYLKPRTQKAQEALSFMRQQESDLFEEIFTFYQFTPQEKKEFLEVVPLFREEDIPTLFTTKRVEAKIDSRIPKDIIFGIHELCKILRINPHSFDIRCNDDPLSRAIAFINMPLRRNAMGIRIFKDGVLIEEDHCYFIEEIVLNLHPNLFSRPQDEIQAILIHEFGHLLEGHPAVSSLLDFFRNTRQKNTTVINKLNKLFEFIANQRLAFESKEGTQKMKSLLFSDFSRPARDDYPSGEESYRSFCDMELKLANL